MADEALSPQQSRGCLFMRDKNSTLSRHAPSSGVPKAALAVAISQAVLTYSGAPRAAMVTAAGTTTCTVTSVLDELDTSDGVNTLRECLLAAGDSTALQGDSNLSFSVVFDAALQGQTIALNPAYNTFLSDTNDQSIALRATPLDRVVALSIDGDIDGDGEPDITLDGGSQLASTPPITLAAPETPVVFQTDLNTLSLWHGTGEPPSGTLSATNASRIKEGGSETYTIRLRDGANTPFNVTADLSVQITLAGTATAGVDYTTAGLDENNQLVIPQGQAQATFTITALTDPLLDNGETIVVGMEPPADNGDAPVLGNASVSTVILGPSPGATMLYVDGQSQQPTDANTEAGFSTVIDGLRFINSQVENRPDGQNMSALWIKSHKDIALRNSVISGNASGVRQNAQANGVVCAAEVVDSNNDFQGNTVYLEASNETGEAPPGGSTNRGARVDLENLSITNNTNCGDQKYSAALSVVNLALGASDSFDAGQVTLSESTIASNTGGGVTSVGGALAVSNSRIEDHRTMDSDDVYGGVAPGNITGGSGLVAMGVSKYTQNAIQVSASSISGNDVVGSAIIAVNKYGESGTGDPGIAITDSSITGNGAALDSTQKYSAGGATAVVFSGPLGGQIPADYVSGEYAGSMHVTNSTISENTGAQAVLFSLTSPDSSSKAARLDVLNSTITGTGLAYSSNDLTYSSTLASIGRNQGSNLMEPPEITVRNSIIARGLNDSTAPGTDEFRCLSMTKYNNEVLLGDATVSYSGTETSSAGGFKTGDACAPDRAQGSFAIGGRYPGDPAELSDVLNTVTGIQSTSDGQRYIALAAGNLNPAINGGNNQFVTDYNVTGVDLANDQRGMGFPRVIAVTVDVGAFEAEDSDGDNLVDLNDSSPNPGDPDSAPSGITITDAEVDPDGETIQLAFTVADYGGRVITGYSATCSAGENIVAMGGSGTEISLTGLDPDTSYECTVSATNAAGLTGESTSLVVLTEALQTGLPVWLIEVARQGTN